MNMHKVMIFPRHEMVFFTVEKVASSSIRDCLRQSFGGAGKSGRAWRESPDYPLADPPVTSFMDYRRWLRIAVTRDPVLRLISTWRDKIREDEVTITDPTGQLRPGMSFEQFATHVCEKPDDRLDRHLLPQTTRMIERGEFLPNHLFALENFPEDWKRIARLVRGRCRVKLRQLNHKNSSPKREVAVPPDLRMRIEQRYERDYTLFRLHGVHYPCSIFDPRQSSTVTSSVG